ncbi:hypothetical protein ZIOFF_003635 [Zingiber officinale]|uniref:Complex 1 LYR protein domain-containing protein n=1 Tax=Zingiber officinale TaxID=94328 RepID=A0A8J5HXZ2_ZINOF|nr:hypothetical protein ZIOFF_003635 [Zingiber officinale]
MQRALRAYLEVLRLVRHLPPETRPYYCKYARENFVNYRDLDESTSLDELLQRAYAHSTWVLDKVATVPCRSRANHESSRPVPTLGASTLRTSLGCTASALGVFVVHTSMGHTTSTLGSSVLRTSMGASALSIGMGRTTSALGVFALRTNFCCTASVMPLY